LGSNATAAYSFEVNSGPDESNNYCEEWVSAKNQIRSMSVQVGVVVVIMNMIIEGSMYLLRGWRKPIDDNKLQTNAMSVIACFQFLTMSVVIVLATINIKLSGAGHFLRLADGRFDDFSSEWYQAVGPQIMAYIYLQLIGPHVLKFLQFAWFHVW